MSDYNQGIWHGIMFMVVMQIAIAFGRGFFGEMIKDIKARRS